jgi:hypothetical protein
LLLTNECCGHEIAANHKALPIVRDDDAAQGSETIVKTSAWPTTAEDVRHYRALGSICRQQAVLHPEASWTWLSQAEKWEDLAEEAMPALASGRTDVAARPRQKAA